MTLVEILIALFIFLLGILGVLSMFPVAMRTAADSMGSARGVILARSALAQITADARVRYALNAANDDTCVITAITATSLDGAGVAWTNDQWIGYYVTLIDGPCQWQSRRITDNTNVQLTVTPNWNPLPLVGNSFVITRLGLPAPQGGRITIVPGNGDTDLDLGSTMSLADDQWNGYTLVMLDGTAKGQQRLITATISATNILQVDPPWEVDGTATPPIQLPQANDRFAILNLQPRDGYVREITGAGIIRAGVQDLTAAPPEVDARNWDDTLWYKSGAPLPHFFLVTSGRATGRLLPILGHAAGDLLNCGTVNWGEIGVRQALRNGQYNLRNATSFRIIGTEGPIASVIPSHFTVESGEASAVTPSDRLDRDTAIATGLTIADGYFLELTSGAGKGQIRSIVNDDGATITIAPPWTTTPAATDKYRIWRYYVNSFVDTSNPSTGLDTYTDANGDEQVASEYSTICIFSNSGPLAAERVQADIFVYRNFDRSQSLIANQKPVAHITGYIGRP